jgi:hypothetical protein
LTLPCRSGESNDTHRGYVGESAPAASRLLEIALIIGAFSGGSADRSVSPGNKGGGSLEGTVENWLGVATACGAGVGVGRDSGKNGWTGTGDCNSSGPSGAIPFGIRQGATPMDGGGQGTQSAHHGFQQVGW